jgi:two-component system response regulator RegA
MGIGVLERPDISEQFRSDRSLLLVEDDNALRDQLADALKAKGFEVTACRGISDSIASIESFASAFAVVDLKLADGNGLAVIQALKQRRDDAKPLVVSGYGTIDLAVAAAKAGAIGFLVKPALLDDITACLLATSDQPKLPARIMSADRMWWEHIHSTVEDCGGNISKAARRLRLHRRSLQRILSKRAPN